ncbi:MAG: hypothetical protein WHT08_16720 [Bryobacteraceae bacterium]
MSCRKLLQSIVPCFAFALSSFAWQAPEGGYEVFSTSRGTLVAWPSDLLNRQEAVAIAESAESDFASSGQLSPATQQRLVIKTKSSPPYAPVNPQENLRRPAPGGGASTTSPAVELRLFTLKTAASASADTVCISVSGPCQPGQPGCRCLDAIPVPEGAPAARAISDKKGANPLILLFPQGTPPASALRAAMKGRAWADFYLKFHAQN